MQRLTLGDLELGLKDMLHTRPEDLALSAFGGLYLPMLAAKRAAIDALSDAFTGGRSSPRSRAVSNPSRAP